MKTKWMIVMAALMMAVSVQADEKGKGKNRYPMTKEAFIAEQKIRYENQGKEFDQAKVEKLFATRDKNADGVLSKDEMPGKKGIGTDNKAEE